MVVGRAEERAQVQANGQETGKQESKKEDRRKTITPSKHFLLCSSVVVQLQKPSQNGSPEQERIQCSQPNERHGGDKGFCLPIAFPLGLVSRGHLFPNLNTY